MKKSALFACFAALGIVGCQGEKSAYKPQPSKKVEPATVTPGQEGDLFPMDNGNKWVFDGVSSQTSPRGTNQGLAEITFEVTKVEDLPEGKTAEITVTARNTDPTDPKKLLEPNVIEKFLWRQGPGGIVAIKQAYKANPADPLADIEYKPPVTVIKFPVKEGETISEKSSGVRPGAGVGDFASDIDVLGYQEVDTAMGRMSALALRRTMKYTRNGIAVETIQNSWYSPKVGMVKYVQTIQAMKDDGQQAVETTSLSLKSHSP